MEPNRFERVLRILENRIERFGINISKELKNTRPFDTEPMSERQKISEFLKLDPRIRDEMRLQYPTYEQRETEMEELIGRKQNVT